MRKIIIYGIMTLLLISIVIGGVILSSKQEAIDLIRAKKLNESQLDFKGMIIDVITDKTGIVRYKTEEEECCTIHYNAYFNDMILQKVHIFLPDNSTLQEDLDLIEANAEKLFRNIIESKQEDVEYIEREMEGIKIEK